MQKGKKALPGPVEAEGAVDLPVPMEELVRDANKYNEIRRPDLDKGSEEIDADGLP
jgi:hypothetical protein